MSIATTVWVGICIGAVLFIISYYVTKVIAENKRLLLGLLTIGLITLGVLVICTAFALLFIFTTNITVAVLVVGAVLGLGVGIPCGFTHYRLRHYTSKGW